MSDNSPFKIASSCVEGVWREDNWGKRSSDTWPEGFKQPRVCSYCGSVNPEDLLSLIKLGWEYEASTKGYKSYWNPPGTAKYHSEILGNFEKFISEKGIEAMVVQAIPPVKLYGNHLTPELLANINSLLLINRAKAPNHIT